MPPPVIREIARLILEAKREFSLHVGIDGIDAAGKPVWNEKAKSRIGTFSLLARILGWFFQTVSRLVAGC
jgi:hypothetical protein